MRLPTRKTTVFLPLASTPLIAWLLLGAGYSPLFASLYALSLALCGSAALSLAIGDRAMCRRMVVASVSILAVSALASSSMLLYVASRCWGLGPQQAVACVAQSSYSIATHVPRYALPPAPFWAPLSVEYPTCLWYAGFVSTVLRLLGISAEPVILLGAGHAIVVANASGILLAVDPDVGPDPVPAKDFAQVSSARPVKAVGLWSGRDYTPLLGYPTAAISSRSCIELKRVGGARWIELCPPRGAPYMITVVAAGRYVARVGGCVEPLTISPGHVVTLGGSGCT